MVTRISPREAHALMTDEGYAYLDVRTEAEFEAGHPEGAYNVPFAHATDAGMAPNPDFVSVVRACFPPGTKLVLGCRSGNRSMRAAEALEAQGYPPLVEQRAGFEGPRDAFGQLLEPGWAKVGLPVSVEPRADRRYAALAGRR